MVHGSCQDRAWVLLHILYDSMSHAQETGLQVQVTGKEATLYMDPVSPLSFFLQLSTLGERPCARECIRSTSLKEQGV